MNYHATAADAKDELQIILDEQPGTYDLDAIAEQVIIHDGEGRNAFRLATEDEGFWDAVLAGAID
ncbi:hypothetical protein [Actinobaculum sp. 352]|uniref:hypothetical protein n=1 Tax=Actinobaculum sp. 352 TaxID=2490946 RepID=UPI000F7E0723|nr:hypothetical protein [Actinobaculum sp. 352]RTE50380.1 hypothetical protein EKN07_04070 [Actinobaculum sp. 352]